MVDRETRDTLIYIHAALMAYVWLIAVPLAIGIAVYGRQYKTKSWGNQHMAIMMFGVLVPLTVAAICAFVASGTIKARPHSLLGTIVVFSAWLQIILGIANHILFRIRRKRNTLPSSKPWHNHLHIWFGRIIFVLAIITIPLGIRIKRPPLGVYIAFAVWVSLLAITFLTLIFNNYRLKNVNHTPSSSVTISPNPERESENSPKNNQTIEVQHVDEK
ncbi:unnamed protein product [Cunninghamella echinulata]